MQRILHCLESCMNDMTSISLTQLSEPQSYESHQSHQSDKYRKSDPYYQPYQSDPNYQPYQYIYQNDSSNRSNESDQSQLSLSPICEHISPMDHEYGQANPAIYPKCVQCRDRGIHNRDIFTTCQNCEYTLCRDCYYGLSPTIFT